MKEYFIVTAPASEGSWVRELFLAEAEPWRWQSLVDIRDRWLGPPWKRGAPPLPLPLPARCYSEDWPLVELVAYGLTVTRVWYDDTTLQR